MCSCVCMCIFSVKHNVGTLSFTQFAALKLHLDVHKSTPLLSEFLCNLTVNITQYYFITHFFSAAANLFYSLTVALTLTLIFLSQFFMASKSHWCSLEFLTHVNKEVSLGSDSVPSRCQRQSRPVFVLQRLAAGLLKHAVVFSRRFKMVLTCWRNRSLVHWPCVIGFYWGRVCFCDTNEFAQLAEWVVVPFGQE